MPLNKSQFIHITDAEWSLLTSGIAHDPDRRVTPYDKTQLPTELFQRLLSEIEEMRRTWMRPDDFMVNCQTANYPNKATHGAKGLPARLCESCARCLRPDYVRITPKKP